MPTTPSPNPKRKGPALVHAVAFLQALIALVFYLNGADDPSTPTTEHPQQSVVMLLATTLLTNGWAIGEHLFRALVRGRKVWVAAVVGLNLGALESSGCATLDDAFPRVRGTEAALDIQPDETGPGCTIIVTIDGRQQDRLWAADCSRLASCVER